MEALNLLKFWRKAVNANNVAGAINYVTSGYHKSDSGDDDDDDSFFELELNSSEQSDKSVESPRDVFRDSNTLSKPQSPVSILKPEPKFNLFVVGFKKTKTRTSEESARKENPKPLENGQNKRFVPKTNGLETPVLSRDNSLRSKILREKLDDFSSTDSATKSNRFGSKLLKPLYSIASKRYNTGESPSVSPMLSPVNSPRRKTSGLKNVCKNIGKSKSCVGMASSPVSSRDDCLLHDGIQGAILHCNMSYNSPAKGTTTDQPELTKRCSI